MPDPVFAGGVIPTAQDFRDLNREWTAFTPTLITDGVGADPALGSGGDFRQEGTYKLQGTNLSFIIALRFGNAGVGPGSGTYVIGLPPGVLAFSADRALSGLRGTAELGNVSTGIRYRFGLYLWTTTSFAIESPGTAAWVNHNSPFGENWAAGDFMWISGDLRVAP